MITIIIVVGFLHDNNLAFCVRACVCVRGLFIIYCIQCIRSLHHFDSHFFTVNCMCSWLGCHALPDVLATHLYPCSSSSPVGLLLVIKQPLLTNSPHWLIQDGCMCMADINQKFGNQIEITNDQMNSIRVCDIYIYI